MYNTSVYDVLRGLTDDEIMNGITIQKDPPVLMDPLALLKLRETFQPGYLTQR